MSIGSTIKKLRHENDMTQEQLAELLNMTSAAVSAWECDRNSPDISQIPLLAHIFGVSADILLGIDLSGQEEKIESIIVKAEKCSAKEAVNIYRAALAEFPASYTLMNHLARSLNYPGEPETYNARLMERIALYERIREGSKDAYLKNSAEGFLCQIYISQGQRDKALQIAESIPKFPFSYDDFELMLAQGKEKIYNMHFNINKSFTSLCIDICNITAIEVDGKPFFTHEQAISMLEKVPKFYEVFYEEKDYLNDSVMVVLAYIRMAEHYAELKDATSAIRSIESALENARKEDAYYEGLNNGFYGITDIWDYPQIPMEKRHTSILANPDLDYPTLTICVDKNSESRVQYCTKVLAHPRFDFIRSEIDKCINNTI